MDRDVIDAEFVVVRGPDQPPEKPWKFQWWNPTHYTWDPGPMLIAAALAGSAYLADREQRQQQQHPHAEAPPSVADQSAADDARYPR